MLETKFHTHAKHLVELWFYILTFKLLDNRWEDRKLWTEL
jgi:hypothetical protein